MSNTRRPVLEEVDDDDIDNLDMDIAEFDPTLKPQLPPSAQSQPFGIRDPRSFSEEEKKQFDLFQMVYPCYFDMNRSHKDGRRVSIDRAVENPLASTIADACRKLGLPVFLELDKTHPQDYGNPGRAKVLYKAVFDGGKLISPKITNKRVLLNLIAEYLAEHTTDLASIGPESGIPYPPEFQTGFTPEEIPKVKGYKMNTIVPVHSSLTLKHPMTKHIYDPEPEAPAAAKQNVPKVPKKKIMKIRG
ncbi:Signal recognition particle SEC65 subunit [Candida viswanathii]|uniref:Signal recognition particle SEC65 subunit n=1 Tax=Candida viswanathii TaxID=5486 RepID=A0A367Y9S8_9ASCO|nr:Signal recognition particle SEC65 subunit [Candida viswanathii]